METNAQMSRCNCNNCPGAGCRCGCQAGSLAALCPCGADCTCAPCPGNAAGCRCTQS